MKHYVYIIRSLKDGTYYKGYTTNYLIRLQAHNNGMSNYTRSKVPWELIYVEVYENKRTALDREKKLKKCKADYFEWLRLQQSNILNK